MSRYIGPVCRLCRRETASSKTGEKIKLFLKGDRCLSKKCAVERRGTAPGQKTAGQRPLEDLRIRPSAAREAEDAPLLRRASRRSSRTISAKRRAFRVRPAARSCSCWSAVSTTSSIASTSRRSRAQARQLVTHRHFRVNGQLVNMPSYIVKPGDVISIGERSLKSPVFAGESRSRARRRPPEWLEWNDAEQDRQSAATPSREQIDTPVDEQLIVEYYSR